MDNQSITIINPLSSKDIFSQNKLQTNQHGDFKKEPFTSKLLKRQNNNLGKNQEQQPIDQKSESQKQQVEDANANFNISVKNSTRRKKIIIFSVIIAAALLITGGVLIYHFFSESNSTEEKTIKIPQNYEKYKDIIQKGQEKNLVEIIYVPKNQKIYEYTMHNNQTTVQGDGKAKENSSKIVHKFGLLCTNITEKEFEIVLYLMDTKTYDDGKLISSITGFPEMLKLEDKKLRVMEEASQNQNSNEQSSSFSFDDISKNSENALMNEYAPLTKSEIEILKTKGISEEQFNFSHYPIIKFSILKNGQINMIEQPINLRNDFFQIYLNVLEQVSPIVSKDSYNIVSKDGKRILSKDGGVFKGRSLTNEEVDKQLTAQKLDNGDMNLNQKFEVNKKPSETSNQNTLYDQSSTIQNGSLLESKVKSGLSMSDNKTSSDPNDLNEMPLFKRIEVKSEGFIKFLSQDDTVDENLFNQIIEYQSEMTIIKQNHSQALELYNSIFNKNEIKGDGKVEKDPEDQNQPDGRMLAEQGADMNPPIQKPVFRNSFASLTFGADIKAECKQFKGTSTKDLCKVGLYSYFNGANALIAEKETRINISKILKYYQKIQNFVQSKLNVIQDDILGSLTKINVDLNGILDKVDELLDVKKNPFLKEIYEIVYNDELQVFTLINTFETFMNKAFTTVSNIVADPFQAIKEQTLSFITFKKNSIESSANSIQNFYVSKLSLIKATVNSQQSINQEDYADIKSILVNIEDILAILIDEPAKKVFDDLEQYVLEKSNKAFGETSTMEKSINLTNNSTATNSTSTSTNSTSISTNSTSTSTNSTQTENNSKSNEKPNFLKKVFGTSTFVETLQKYLLQAMNKISEVKDFSDMATGDLKKNISKLANEVLDVIEKLPKTSANRSDSVRNSLEEFENVFEYSLDLTAGLVEVKDEIDMIFKTITIIQSKESSKIVENIASNLTGFPVELLSQIKSQGQTTVEKFKLIAENMKNNISQWMDQLLAHTKNLLEDAKMLYEGLKKFFSKVEFDENDPEQYKKPLFDEVDNIFGSVNGILQVNTGAIVDTYQRFYTIPNKFKVFLADFKDLGERTFNYFKDIGLSVSGIYFDQKELWSNFGQKPQAQAQVYNNQLQSTVEKDVNQGIIQQNLPAFSNQVSNMVNKDVTSYQNSILDSNKSMSQKVKQVLLDIIKQADFEGRVESQRKQKSFKLESSYSYAYPTPIGISLTMNLSASWQTLLFFEIKVKNAILDLGAGVETKVILGGSASVSAYVAEVGGYVEGTFFNAKLKLGLNLRVLENFRGSIYLDANYLPYQVKMGLFYKTIFQIEEISCSKRIRRQLFLDWFTDEIKKIVQATKNGIETVTKFVKKVGKCLSTLTIKCKRNDVFDPIDIQGKAYSAQLFKVEF